MTLRPLFWTVLLLCLCLTPASAAPPIRCVHQTTVVKDGKATTHLILTTGKPGEAQTAENTADVFCSGRMDSIVTNGDQTLAAVAFTPDMGHDVYHRFLYLFVSTAHQGLSVLPNFQQQVAKALLADPLRTVRRTSLGRNAWNDYGGPAASRPPTGAKRQGLLRSWRNEVNEDFQHEFSFEKIDGSLLSMRADRAEINEIFFTVRWRPSGRLTVIDCWSEGE